MRKAEHTGRQRTSSLPSTRDKSKRKRGKEEFGTKKEAGRVRAEEEVRVT